MIRFFSSSETTFFASSFSTFLQRSSLAEGRRFKSKSIRVANRLRVERFQAVRYTLPTRLDTASPTVAEEWDYEKNPMHVYPKIVSAGSVHDVWWLCRDCGSSFAMSPEKRVLRGGSCPHCASADKERGGVVDPASREEVELLAGEKNAMFRPSRNTEMPPRSRY